MTTRRFMGWVLPGLFFSVGFGFAACTGANSDDDCDAVVTTTGAGGAGGAGGTASTTTSGGGGVGAESAGDPEVSADGNNFHHPMDPSQPGQDDPFEIVKKRAAEGPPEVRTRLHSCQKLNYGEIGDFLKSRGVNLDAVAPNGQPPTAGQLYKAAATRDALGVANYDARMGEAYFYTISAATKLFDIFVQAAPEIIANVQNADACKVAGVGYPLFDPQTGNCAYYALSCIMGRPASDDDMQLCNLMVSQANGADPKDLANKRAITVAAFLSASHTCE